MHVATPAAVDPLDVPVDDAERGQLYGDVLPLELDRDAGGWWHGWAVLALTLFGGILRFLRLDHPTFWIDEAFTYWRVSGTYGELVDILRQGGFTPLHYQANWLLGRATSLSPFHMRLIPAVAGTLMIPAMYFLARQVTGRGAALLTAAFTACSAYLLSYSRDAKMYMDCWLFVALHFASLMWWLRTRRPVAWLAWVAAGLAMAGIHGTSMILFIAEPLILLTARNVRWQTTLAFVAGLALIGAGPGGYYGMFNQWAAQIEEKGWSGGSGLSWVDFANAGRGDDALEMLRYPATAFLLNWEWPRPQDEANIDPRVLYHAKNVAFALGVLLVLGMFPWRTRLRARVVFLNDAHPAPGEAPEPWWRGTLWIAAMIVLPLFLFHLVSAARVVSPAEWWEPVRLALFGTPPRAILTGVALAAAFSCAGVTLGERVAKTTQLLLIGAALFLICFGLGKLVSFRNTDSVWVPRYLGMVWPALAVAACVLICRLPGWPLRSLAIALLLGANLANYAAKLVYHSQPPLDRVAADVVAGQAADGATRTFLSTAEGRLLLSPGILAPEGRYYLSQAAGVRLRPRDFLVDNFDFRTEPFVKAIGFAPEVGTGPETVKEKLTAAPGVARLVLWDQFTGPRPAPPTPPDADPVLAALGPGWRRIHATDHPVYTTFNFAWVYSHTYRRREYVRDGE